MTSGVAYVPVYCFLLRCLEFSLLWKRLTGYFVTCRENEQLKDYSRHTKAQRILVFQNIKMLIQANPVIQHKLTFPRTENSRLRALINHRFYFSDNFMIKINSLFGFATSPKDDSNEKYSQEARA